VGVEQLVRLHDSWPGVHAGDRAVDRGAGDIIAQGDVFLEWIGIDGSATPSPRPS
jgi:hypothetical protein